MFFCVMECVALVSQSNTIKRQADSGGPESAAILEKLKIDYAAIAE